MLQQKVDTGARAFEALVGQQEHMSQQLQDNTQNTAASIAGLSTVMYGSARLQGRHTSVVSPPQLAFGTSLSVHDPLYTGSLLVAPPKGHLAEPCIQLRGVVLHSRLLRLTHILGCVELSQFVQRFLTRLVMAHPGRPNSQCVSELVLPVSRLSRASLLISE
jgi:hypothetical protein